ncbi:MAG: hypothetical protein RJR35_09715 [Thermoanaerobacterales bacterium]|nr:hypothetical protein [Thermoanaerobacterales bacterium]
MISEAVKVNFMDRLKRKATPKFPKNIFKEYLFTDRSVRYITERYRSGEMTSADIYARLGETAGLFVIALSEGYHIKDIAKTAKLTPGEVRTTVIKAVRRAQMLNLLPVFDDPMSQEVNFVVS